MDFFKKNWGLLLYALGCLALAVVIGVNISRAAVQASTKHKALDEQLEWFKGVKKDNLKLSKENERAAQDNRDRAERKFAEVRLTMASKYRIDPRSPATPVEAVRKLQEELRTTARMLDEADPPVDYKGCPALSFGPRAISKDLPAMEEVPQIFRQLYIVKEIVGIVARSHLYSIVNIERPMDLAVIAEDLYTATPVNMTVTGTADQVQSFINRMTTEANYLFFLRDITLTTADQAPNGALGAVGGGATGATAMGMGGAGMEAGMAMGAGMGPGMGAGAGMGAAMGMGAGAPPGMGAAMGMGMLDPKAGTGRAARSPRASRRGAAATPAETATPPGMAMMNPGGKPPRAAAADAARQDGSRTGTAPQEPMWCDQLRAFSQEALVTVELRFDVIEFNQPEASQ